MGQKIKYTAQLLEQCNKSMNTAEEEKKKRRQFFLSLSPGQRAERMFKLFSEMVMIQTAKVGISGY